VSTSVDNLPGLAVDEGNSSNNEDNADEHISRYLLIQQ
jgi:hypothetical protein